MRKKMVGILKNIGQIQLIFHVHILGTYVHQCAKYEVSKIKSVARTVHRRHQMTPHDSQFMIVQAHWHF